MSPGEQLLDLVHIDDVRAHSASAPSICCEIEAPQPHERYAISSGKPLSVRQLVALLEQLSGKRLNVIFGARPYRTREVMQPWTDGAWLPGWRPE